VKRLSWDFMITKTSFSSSIFPCHQKKEETGSMMLAQAINRSSSRARTIFTASSLVLAVINTIMYDIGSPTETIDKCAILSHKSSAANKEIFDTRVAINEGFGHADGWS
jgi:hypothetical protein